VVIGVGGLIDPKALGVGYDTIHAELLGQLALGALVLLLVVKLVIWSTGLGAGTSGGIIAPVLMMGAAIGGALGHLLPGATIGVWSLIGMTGVLAGTTGAPFTAVIFAVELTHDQNSLLALLVAAILGYLVSVLVLKHSIVTEKVARRGVHVMREYAVDPLEAMYVRDMASTAVRTLAPADRAAAIHAAFAEGSDARRQRLYPVRDRHGHMTGVVPWSAIVAARADPVRTVGELIRPASAVAYPDEVLRTVADRMAAAGVGIVPVVLREDPGALVGLIGASDLLRARQRLLIEEHLAERVLRVVGRRRRRPAHTGTGGAGPSS
jgi:CBS domain-containing protein